MAANFPSKADMIIARLRHRPLRMTLAANKITEIYKLPRLPTTLTLGDRSSSLGLLDRFPSELIIRIMGQLDLQGLARLSQVSIQANDYVLSFRDYRSLVLHAPVVVQALTKMGLVGLHSAGDLYSTLRAGACAVCGELGPFLYLPTCQRCCWSCWGYYPSFRIMPINHARRLYDLSNDDMVKLPVLHVPDLGTPGDVLLPLNPPPPSKPNQAVSAKAAHELAIAVYGSERKVAEAVMEDVPSLKRRFEARYWLEAPNVAPHSNWLTYQRAAIPWEPRESWRYNYDMPPIPFPVLKAGDGDDDGRREQVSWCRGCERAWDDTIMANHPGNIWTFTAFFTPQPPVANPQLVLPPEYLTDEYRSTEVARGRANRAWPRAGFLHHIRHCPGTRLCAPDLADLKEEEWDQIISDDMKLVEGYGG
ncbi:hypothetical protein PG984_013971 [Apiospora sp. TS-2023a]